MLSICVSFLSKEAFKWVVAFYSEVSGDRILYSVKPINGDWALILSEYNIIW